MRKSSARIWAPVLSTKRFALPQLMGLPKAASFFAANRRTHAKIGHIGISHRNLIARDLELLCMGARNIANQSGPRYPIAMPQSLGFRRILQDQLPADGLVRPAIEKFAGAWLACFLVMARGDFANALSLEHARLASICGIVGAVVSIAMLAQMDRKLNSSSRQATISAFATFIGDIFAHPSHFPPQWAEPLVTAMVSAAIAVVVWHAQTWAKRYR